MATLLGRSRCAWSGARGAGILSDAPHGVFCDGSDGRYGAQIPGTRQLERTFGARRGPCLGCGPANGGGTLYDRKGRPETFDAEGFAEALARVRAAEDVSLPLYDRKTHDPAECALLLDVSHRVVFCEGNFLYLDTPRWRAVARLLDVRLFVEAPESLLRRNLSERFRRGGRSRAEIDEQWRRVDVPNVADIEPGIKAAHLVFVKDATNTLHTIRV